MNKKTDVSDKGIEKSRIIQRAFYNSKDPMYLEYQHNIPYAKYLVKKMLPFIHRKRLRVLEVGAGQGRFTFELAHHVDSLIATDLSIKELRLLRGYVHSFRTQNIQTRLYDLLDTTHGRHRYDSVVGFFVLHHLPRERLRVVVKGISSHLRRGGSMCFIEPNNLYPFHVAEWLFVKDMEWYVEKGIYTNYLGMFKRALREEGFAIRKFQKFGFLPPPLINRIPGLTKIDDFVNQIPIIRQVACPFVLIVASKS
jgi:2-polyprenyl-3-methyl-5-hydroxy-6-metoxy-1,4-benzoquinol methylase